MLGVIDVGTTRVKLVVLDEEVNVRYSFEAPTPRIAGGPGSSLIDASRLWELIVSLARRAKSLGARELGFSLHRSSVLAWDRSGRPLSPIVAWDDKSVLRAYRRVVPFRARLLGRVSRQLGAVLAPEASLARLLYLYREMGLARRIARGEAFAWTLDSWILYRVSREFVSEASHSAVTGLVHPRSLKPIGLVLGLVGLDDSVVPGIVDTYYEAGSLEGLGVVAITSDQQAALIASGALGEGAYKVSMGTGLFVDKYTSAEYYGPRRKGIVPLLVAKTKKGRWYALEGFTASAGSLLDTIVVLTGKGYEGIEEEARRAASPVVVVPGLQGLQFPPRRHARGAVLGLTKNTRLPDLALGVYASIALQAAAIVRELGSVVGEEASIIRVDGGLTRSRLVLELLAEYTGCRVEVVGLHAPARGTGVVMLYGDGFEPSRALEYLRVEGVYEPRGGGRPSLVDRWLKLLDLFTRSRGAWRIASELSGEVASSLKH